MDSMNRRKFFQRLGLTAAVAAIAPRLLAGESAPTNKGPILYYYLLGGDQVVDHAHYEFEYMKAYKVAWKPVPWLTILVLPKPVAWAKHQIIIRDTMNKSEIILPLDSWKDLHITPRNDTKVEVAPFGPKTGDSTMTIVNIEPWQ